MDDVDLIIGQASEHSSWFRLWFCFNRNKLALGLLNNVSRVCLSEAAQLLFSLRGQLTDVKMSPEK